MGGHSSHVPGNPKAAVDIDQQTLSGKGPIINNLGFAGHTVSVTTNHLCFCNASCDKVKEWHGHIYTTKRKIDS